MSVDDAKEKVMSELCERFQILNVDGLSELSKDEIEDLFNAQRTTFSLQKEQFDSIVEGSDFDPVFDIVSYYAESINDLSSKQFLMVWFLMEDLFFLGRQSGIAKGISDNHETLKNYTKFIKTKIQPDNIAKDIYAKAGAKKFYRSREAAFKWMREALQENPSLSKNRLAAMLEAKSKEEGRVFGRVIPEGTAKDYARKCINDFINGVE